MLPQQVIEGLQRKVGELGTKRVLIQLPEGLKPKALSIARELEKLGFDPVISGDPCFGACDLRFLENSITLHIGHSKMLEDPRVVYWEYRYDIDPSEAIIENLNKIEETKLGLVTTVQHINHLGKMADLLRSKGKQVWVGDPGPRSTYPGQVLGCDTGSATSVSSNVDAFLFIGTGVFHPLLVTYQTRKKVYAVDPFSKEMQVITGERFEKEKALRITKAMESKRFGVVMSSKPGQYFPEVAREVVKRIREKGYEAYEIILDLITPEILKGLGFDCYVITACPRIVLDDWKNYSVPILLPEEVYSLLEIK